MFDNREMGCVYDHKYCLASYGLGKDKDKEYIFGSRDKAVSKMYKIINKQGLSVKEVYEDNHDKTYKCENGIKFFISRAF